MGRNVVGLAAALAVFAIGAAAGGVRFKSQPLQAKPVAGAKRPRYVSYVLVQQLVVRPQDASPLDDVVADLKARGEMSVLSVDRSKGEILVERPAAFVQRDEDGERAGSQP